MSHPHLSGEEISRRGQALYEQRIRPVVETGENIGKLIAIDIETGNYEIVGESGLAARERLLKKNPDAVLFAVRIGYDVAYALGGTLRRTTRP